MQYNIQKEQTAQYFWIPDILLTQNIHKQLVEVVRQQWLIKRLEMFLYSAEYITFKTRIPLAEVVFFSLIRPCKVMKENFEFQIIIRQCCT
jgi:hypothetical protein